MDLCRPQTLKYHIGEKERERDSDSLRFRIQIQDPGPMIQIPETKTTKLGLAQSCVNLNWSR
jgi:hypothetical protein